MKLFRFVLGSIAALPMTLGNWATPFIAVIGLLIGVAGLLAGPSAHAQAGCNYHVGAPGQGDWVECPNASQQSQPRTVIRPYTLFVAIAFSPSTNYASIAYHYEKLDQAESVALSSCRRKGADCKILVTTTRCVALAQSAPEGAYGYSSNDLMDPAVTKALQECRSGGGKSCKITRQHCSDDT